MDYAFGILLAASPWIFGFADQHLAPNFALVFGGGTILYSLFTNYELGLIRLLPFPGHLLLDALAGILLAANWLHFAFGGRAAVVFTVFGAVELAVVLLSLRANPPKTQGLT
jgi:hypothetical protein